MTQKEIRTRLCQIAEEDYKEFSASLIPGVTNMLGIRLPILRGMAKELVANKEYWYLTCTEFAYFEEIMLQGMMIGYIKTGRGKDAMPFTEVLVLVREFMPRITNWSVNDSFCTTFHAAKKNREEMWEFLMDYKNSHKEYEVRVVAVMLMAHFLVPEYIKDVLAVLGKLDASQYYASMAIAWAYATAWAKFPNETKEYLNSHVIDEKTYQRLLQKCMDSHRIKEEDKELIRSIYRIKGNGREDI